MISRVIIFVVFRPNILYDDFISVELHDKRLRAWKNQSDRKHLNHLSADMFRPVKYNVVDKMMQFYV